MKRVERRPIDGILLLDKPGGMTSNAALQRVRRLLNARKAGHTGSLDPLATGLLPLCFGEATKVSGFLLDADKRYRVLIRLGLTTTTADRDGEPLTERDPAAVTLEQIQALLPRFTGEIQQVPPMYSALKHQGERLYKLARQGLEVERPARRVVVHAIELIGFDNPALELEVHCSKGTYIRSLAEDLGQALEVGAHVQELRRTGLGPFTGLPMVGLEELQAWSRDEPGRIEGALLDIDAALTEWPEVRLEDETAAFVCQGQAVFVPRAPAGELVRLYGRSQGFLGVGRVGDDGRVAPKRLLARAAQGQ